MVNNRFLTPILGITLLWLMLVVNFVCIYIMIRLKVDSINYGPLEPIAHYLIMNPKVTAPLSLVLVGAILYFSFVKDGKYEQIRKKYEPNSKKVRRYFHLYVVLSFLTSFFIGNYFF